MTAGRSSSSRIRPSAKAVVVSGGKLLVTRNRTPGDPGDDWHILPGGGQQPGETLAEALRREVREETGFEVEPGRLLWIRELIVERRHDWNLDPNDLHAIEFMFESELLMDHGDGHAADLYQVGVEWVGADQLTGLRFYPGAVVPWLVSHMAGGESGPIYLGDTD